MFWYIWFLFITISIISLAILDYKKDWDIPSFAFFMLFCFVVAFSMIPLSSNSPSPEHSTLVETLPIERLNSDNTSKYILIDGEEYSLKAIVKMNMALKKRNSLLQNILTLTSNSILLSNAENRFCKSMNLIQRFGIPLHS